MYLKVSADIKISTFWEKLDGGMTDEAVEHEKGPFQVQAEHQQWSSCQWSTSDRQT